MLRATTLLMSASLTLASIAVAQTPERPAAPQEAPPSHSDIRKPAAAASAACAGRTDVLGVSRVVEVDTKGGPQFGLQQYKGLDFLEDGEVVLTFDDGPLRPYTTPVLNALDAHCTRATFFIVGRMAVADPEMVREMVRRGHTVGTHTWSHKNLRATAPVQAKGEIELGVSVAGKIIGKQTAPFFRFPYLSDPKGMIGHNKSRDLGMFSIDVDSRDFRTRNPADVIRVVLSQLKEKRKGIVLFHDIQPSTAGGLRILLGELKSRGFKIVHLTAKEPPTTLPEYDAIAERELSRKQIAAARDPLATRSVVWPVAAAPGGEPAAKSPPRAATQRQLAPTSASKDATLPWQKAAPNAAAPPPPATAAVPAPPPRKRPTDDDEDWALKIFRN